jgi:DNA mismatch endonuclease (patch repair protein)
MSDIFDKEKRSSIMRSVKSSKNQSTELKLISIFKENNIKGWRRGVKLKGKPDFIFRDKKIAIFADGCFWHGHQCRNTKPRDNSDYWHAKIQKNMQRDIEVTNYLTQKGWKVIRIWECELAGKNKDKLFDKLFYINQAISSIEINIQKMIPKERDD